MKARVFVDSITLHATAGNGGNGVVSFRREKFVPKGGPDGGDGGRGGHVILKASDDVDSLLAIYYAPRRRATPGDKGGGARMTGHDGKDIVIDVPCGTVIHDRATGAVLGELIDDHAEMIVAQGGKGGKGNWHWRSATHQTPMEHTDGELGKDVELQLELKIVAEVGLVGFPNAGKSALISSISKAHPKVAPYPFTTLHPIMGTVFYDDYSRLRVADIPGLIPGAHSGVGLGHAFLRHVERSQVLVYVIDMAGVDGRKPYEDYRVLRNELGLYSRDLLKRESICVANKMDLPEAAANLKEFKRKLRIKPLEISALTGAGLAALKKALRTLCPAVATPGGPQPPDADV